MLPPPPWQPLLRPAELQRGLAFYGSGARIQRVAARLLAGEPIKAFTIGGSVTRGAGASSPDTTFAERFFAFLNSTFPHRWGWRHLGCSAKRGAPDATPVLSAHAPCRHSPGSLRGQRACCW